MGRYKFNAKARQTRVIQVDNQETRKIHVDSGTAAGLQCDESNILVLPSKKRPTKVKSENVQITRILSKKQRKRLEKVVDQKKKKENRSALIEALSTVQVSHSQLAGYSSISSIQTKGLKKLKREKVKINKGPPSLRAKSNDTVEGTSSKLNSKRRISHESSSSDSELAAKKFQRNPDVIGFDEDPSSLSDENDSRSSPLPSPPTQPIELPKLVEASVKTEAIKQEITPKPRKPAVYIKVDRDPKIQAARLRLPILAEEQIIMETISNNDVVIIAGETGSGKTTQLPQFLYEAGYACEKLIGITEPRRVAAVSMSKRVATEMNLSPAIVSYLMRFEGNVTDQTKIKFMTDGVLLKEVESDFLLRSYGTIILDEAHERSVFTDILIGILSRVVLVRRKENNPLKLIIMSATLRVQDFTENKLLFRMTPPVLKVESRQYPVTVHFNKKTEANYLMEAYKKVMKIHSTLPDGGILIFLTGQKEVNELVQKLRKAFPFRAEKHSQVTVNEVSSEETFDEEDWDTVRHKKQKFRKKQRISRKGHLRPVNLDAYSLPNEEDNDYLDSDPENKFDRPKLSEAKPLWVLPLYSALSSEKQNYVFQEPPPGTRLCVVATNVAETSITIPNIKYVIDSGRQKTKVYDKQTGISTYMVTFTSKASASQRSGRAGRMGPGHCYRLYSSAVFKDEFQEFSKPEIQEKPIDDLLLQLKMIGIERVDKFPFPSMPDFEQLKSAEKRLKMLQILEDKIVVKSGKQETILEVTSLGKTVSRFPVSPRFGKLIALGNQGGLLPYILCIVAALSVPNVLEESTIHLEAAEDETKLTQQVETLKRIREIRYMWADEGESRLLGDTLTLLQAIVICLKATDLEECCTINGLRIKAVQEILKIRQQLTNDLNLNSENINLPVAAVLEPPSSAQINLLRQIMLSAFGDKVARKLTKEEIKSAGNSKEIRHAYKCIDVEEMVFIHNESVLKYENPEYVIYQEAFEVVSPDGKKTTFIKGITAINPEWLPKYVPDMCNILRILDKPEPRYDAEKDEIICTVQASFSRGAWQLPPVELPMELSVNLYKHFGKSLLAGLVFTSLKTFTPDLLSSAEFLVKAYGKSNSRVTAFLNALIAKEAHSRKKLQELWMTDRNYLLEEYKLWLPNHLHMALKKQWPPTD